MFNGPEYDPEQDDERLRNQYRRIFDLMKDKQWRTYKEIRRITNTTATVLRLAIRAHEKARANADHKGQESLFHNHYLVGRFSRARKSFPISSPCPICRAGFRYASGGGGRDASGRPCRPCRRDTCTLRRGCLRAPGRAVGRRAA